MDTIIMSSRPKAGARLRKWLSLPCLGLLCSGVPTALSAAEWTIVPRVNIDQVYSDNVRLQSEAAAQAEFVTTVEPGIVVRGNGRRLNLAFDYNLETLVYKRDADSNAINHQMQLSGDAELWKQIAFLEFRATRSQENSNTLSGAGTDNISVSNNRTDVQTYSLTPIFRHRLGNYIDVESRTTINQVSNETGSTRSTSTSFGSTATLSSGDYFARLPWSISVTDRRVTNSSGTKNTFKKLQSEARYNFSRKYGVLARLASERNEFSSNQPETGGASWDLGFTWTPSPRTEIELGGGRRFFGNSVFLDLSHRTRRMLFTASFSEDITTSRDEQLERILVPLVDAAGIAVFDPISGAQISVPIDNLTSSEEVIVQSRFDGSVTYEGRRTTLGLTGFSSFRTGQLNGAESEVIGSSLTLNHKLNRLISMDGRLGFQSTSSGTQEDQRFNWSVSMRGTLGRSLSASVGYDYVTLKSSVAANEFDENRIRIGVVASF